MIAPLWRRLMFMGFLVGGGALTVYLLLLAEGIKYDPQNSNLIPTSSLYLETIPRATTLSLDNKSDSSTSLKRLAGGIHQFVWSYPGTQNRNAEIKIIPPQSYVLPPVRLVPAKPTLRALTGPANLICSGSKNILIWTAQSAPAELRLSLINQGDGGGAFLYKANAIITDCVLSPDEKNIAIKVSGLWAIINLPETTNVTRLGANGFSSWLTEKYYWDKNKNIYALTEDKPLLIASDEEKTIALGDKFFKLAENPDSDILTSWKKETKNTSWQKMASYPDFTLTDYKIFDAYILLTGTKNQVPWLYLISPDDGEVKYRYIGHDIFWHNGYRRWFIRFGKNLQSFEKFGDRPLYTTSLPIVKNPTPDSRSSLVYYLEGNSLMAQETNGLWQEKIIVATFPNKIETFWTGPEQQLILWLNDGISQRLISLDLLP